MSPVALCCTDLVLCARYTCNLHLVLITSIPIDFTIAHSISIYSSVIQWEKTVMVIVL